MDRRSFLKYQKAMNFNYVQKRVLRMVRNRVYTHVKLSSKTSRELVVRKHDLRSRIRSTNHTKHGMTLRNKKQTRSLSADFGKPKKTLAVENSNQRRSKRLESRLPLFQKWLKQHQLVRRYRKEVDESADKLAMINLHNGNEPHVEPIRRPGQKASGMRTAHFKKKSI